MENKNFGTKGHKRCHDDKNYFYLKNEYVIIITISVICSKNCDLKQIKPPETVKQHIPAKEGSGFLQIAIVDDLEQDRSRLLGLVQSCLGRRQLEAEVSTFADAKAFFKEYTSGKYDIVFLDMYMNGPDGLRVAQQMREQGDACQLIFVTSSDAFAVRSYEVEASHYLLKPVEQAAVEQAMCRCLQRLGQQRSTIRLVANRVPIQVPLASILWIGSERNAMVFHTDGGQIRCYMTYESALELLKGDPRFLPCYKGCLVNMDRVTSFLGDCFVVDNDERVPVRKRGAGQIRQQYVQYLCERASV